MRACHCLCGFAHPQQSGVCQALNATTSRDVRGRDVQMCEPCAALRLANEPQPKCVRVLVTLIYGDGSSMTYDIKQPAGQPEVELTEDIPEDITVMRPLPVRFRLSVVLGEQGVRAELSPLPDTARDQPRPAPNLNHGCLTA